MYLQSGSYRVRDYKIESKKKRTSANPGKASEGRSSICDNGAGVEALFPFHLPH